MHLSKSDYMLFLKHPAWLWIKKNSPEALPPIDAATQAIFDTGHEFEQYAESLHPKGVRLGFNFKDDSYDTLPDRTAEALAGGAKTIYQGRFVHGKLTFICDIINVIDGKTIDLIEIKSSTQAKAEHLKDLAFQMIVLEGCGYEVRKVSVIHVNNQYVRSGNVDSGAICTTTDVTDVVKALREFTSAKSAEALDVLASGIQPDMSPLLADPKSFNEWMKIYKYIRQFKPGSIYDLCQLYTGTYDNLKKSDIDFIDEIPEDFELKPKQALQVEATRRGSALVQKHHIKLFLESLKYPLFFFDYETLSSLVPYFDGLRPYQQLPFQYSLHVINQPGGELMHYEYLHRDSSNPAEPLSKALQAQIGNKGTVLAWNMSFEKSCNSLLGSLLPEFNEFYEQLNDRIVDLMSPFSNGWYVDKDFKGSASIKAVLPVLVPQLSYKSLGIQEGASAQRLWMQAVLDGKLPDQKEKILNDLTEYCKLDTLAMVEIYKVLRSL